jgi:hypothetical protein
VHEPSIQSPMGTRPALSAGLPSITSNTCHTLSIDFPGSHMRILRPNSEGLGFKSDPFVSLLCNDHLRDGIIGTTVKRSEVPYN